MMSSHSVLNSELEIFLQAHKTCSPPPSDFVERADNSVAYSSNGKVNDRHSYPDSFYKSTLVPEVVQELPVTSPADDFRQPHYSSSSNYGKPWKRVPTMKRTIQLAAGHAISWRRTESGNIHLSLQINKDNSTREILTLPCRNTSAYKHMRSIKNSHLYKELDDYREEREEYMAVADEYNRQKEVKGYADYKSKRSYYKQLKSKLSHINKMVGHYDKWT